MKIKNLLKELEKCKKESEDVYTRYICGVMFGILNDAIEKGLIGKEDHFMKEIKRLQKVKKEFEEVKSESN